MRPLSTFSSREEGMIEFVGWRRTFALIGILTERVDFESFGLLAVPSPSVPRACNE